MSSLFTSGGVVYKRKQIFELSKSQVIYRKLFLDKLKRRAGARRRNRQRRFKLSLLIMGMLANKIDELSACEDTAEKS